MSRWSLMLGVCLVAGCQSEPPPPPVVPMVEDLSTWSVPELVQPERRVQGGPQRVAKVPGRGRRESLRLCPGRGRGGAGCAGPTARYCAGSWRAGAQIVDGDRAPARAGPGPPVGSGGMASGMGSGRMCL